MDSLVILTSRFPYPPGEEFLKGEIEELSKFFSAIKIMPVTYPIDEDKQKEIPKNVAVIKPLGSSGKAGRVLQMLGDFQAMRWFMSELPNASKIGIKAVLKLLNWTAIASEIKRALEKGQIDSNAIYYSYWLTPSATSLAMLKEKGIIQTAVSRVHGGDLYQERHQPPYLPFQKKVISILNQTYSISANGKEYLTKLHQLPEGKITISRLGTKNEHPFQALIGSSHSLRIISCSYLKPVKRIHLLVEALKKVGVIVEWTHIGDGPERGKIENMMKELPENISARLLGNLNNHEVIQNYEQHSYDLFINVSESEGIPVTIMEAYSFGIPAIATDVGGTSELVNPDNGYLLPKEFTPRELADRLEEFHRLDADSKSKKSRSAYYTWDQNYNSQNNYKKFTDDLKGVSL
ncbi:MAG TPA: glycosyltransferase [Bacillales bacterium]|nr:glycosyltransferase [Bacillales bacterium]